MESKICQKCGERKPLAQFSKRPNSRDGHRNDCLKCQCKRQNKWMKENRYEQLQDNWHKKWERIKVTPNKPQELYQRRKELRIERERKAKAAEYREAHRQQFRSYQKSYTERAKDKVNAAIHKWQQSNKEHIKEVRRERYARNPQADLAKTHERRAKLQDTGTYTEQEWQSLCMRYGNICLCCKQSKPLTVDHVIPLSKGGANTIDNLQPLCLSCNARKCDKTIDYRS